MLSGHVSAVEAGFLVWKGFFLFFFPSSNMKT